MFVSIREPWLPSRILWVHDQTAVWDISRPPSKSAKALPVCVCLPCLPTFVQCHRVLCQSLVGRSVAWPTMLWASVGLCVLLISMSSFILKACSTPIMCCLQADSFLVRVECCDWAAQCVAGRSSIPYHCRLDIKDIQSSFKSIQDHANIQASENGVQIHIDIITLIGNGWKHYQDIIGTITVISMNSYWFKTSWYIRPPCNPEALMKRAKSIWIGSVTSALSVWIFSTGLWSLPFFPSHLVTSLDMFNIVTILLKCGVSQGVFLKCC